MLRGIIRLKVANKILPSLKIPYKKSEPNVRNVINKYFFVLWCLDYIQYSQLFSYHLYTLLLYCLYLYIWDNVKENESINLSTFYIKIFMQFIDFFIYTRIFGIEPGTGTVQSVVLAHTYEPVSGPNEI